MHFQNKMGRARNWKNESYFYDECIKQDETFASMLAWAS